MSEYKSIKVREDVYEELKKMGIGISKAIEILLKEQKEKIMEKMESIEKIAQDIGEVMLSEGIFDIRFRGAKILDVQESDDDIAITGMVVINIPNEHARKVLIEKLKPKEG